VTRSVLIVGLGRIGMGYDFELGGEYVLTHARAFQQHGYFELLGGVDIDPRLRRAFVERYRVPSFADIAEAMDAVKPNVVAIATPTQLHAQSVRAVLQSGSPAAILCEKPLSFDLDEARGIVELCTVRGCALYVNYIRRAEPGVAEVERRLRDGLIGTPVKGVGWYSKGLLNNASHFINLLEHWLGEVCSARVVNAGRLWAGIDPEPDFTVCFAQGQVTFLAAKEEHFSHCALDIVAPNGRLRYEQGGERISWQKTVADPAYPGYMTLETSAESITTDFARMQWHVADQLASSLSGHQAHICSGAEALRTLQVLTSIRTDT
jgi:predicted dehydrogenase